MVGDVESVEVNQNQTFYNIVLRLATDFPNLSYVYVVKNNQVEEQQQLKKSNEKIIDSFSKKVQEMVFLHKFR